MASCGETETGESGTVERCSQPATRTVLGSRISVEPGAVVHGAHEARSAHAARATAAGRGWLGWRVAGRGSLIAPRPSVPLPGCALNFLFIRWNSLHRGGESDHR